MVLWRWVLSCWREADNITVGQKQNDVRGGSSFGGMAAAGRFLLLAAPILSFFTAVCFFV